MGPASNEPMPAGPQISAMPEAQVVTPTSTPLPTEVPPPPPGLGQPEAAIAASPVPAAEPHVDTTIGAPEPAATPSDPHFDSPPVPAVEDLHTEPVIKSNQPPTVVDNIKEQLTPPEDSKARITQVFRGLDDAMKGAGDNEAFKAKILEAAQGVVDSIMEESGFKPGTVNVDSRHSEELPKAA